MAGTRVNVKEVLKDLQAGLHPNALMGKYGLSPSQFHKLLKKLEQLDLLRPLEATEGAQLAGILFRCPHCGALSTEPFSECSRCGKVVSKISQAGPPEDRAAMAKSLPMPAAGGSVSPLEQGGSPRALVIAVLALVGVLAVVFVGWRQHQQGKETAQYRAVQKRIAQVMEPVAFDERTDWPVISDRFNKALEGSEAVWVGSRAEIRAKLTVISELLVDLAELQEELKIAQKESDEETRKGKQADENRKAVQRKVEDAKQELTEIRDQGRQGENVRQMMGEKQEPVATFTRSRGQLVELEARRSELESKISQLELEFLQSDSPGKGPTDEQVRETSARMAVKQDELIPLWKEVLESLNKSR